MKEQIRAMRIGMVAGIVALLLMVMLFNATLADAATVQVQVTANIPQVLVLGSDALHVTVQTNMPNVKTALTQEGFVYMGHGIYQAPIGTDFVVPAY